MFIFEPHSYLNCLANQCQKSVSKSPLYNFLPIFSLKDLNYEFIIFSYWDSYVRLVCLKAK